ncbi:hypothetical protein C5E07_08780 [Pseudoclavibacter sp. RFBJ3]|nr:hypothetical protein C5C12_07185 [Pseudoclavibacter sp. RFBJ5]PPF92871.1 hypothetical protein C5E07_08780 [Pseudoclavibacter sp. RFBJ3]PPF98056.1 hypothetical protein C5C19_09460 [Pseudoclavibacter sp. RFBH5]PPG25126.1 hypothetical protein C5E13_03490 [Pseudoclavibacter sp. RFBI4]
MPIHKKDFDQHEQLWHMRPEAGNRKHLGDQAVLRRAPSPFPRTAKCRLVAIRSYGGLDLLQLSSRANWA